MTVFFFITHIRQFSSNQTNQIKCTERGKKRGGGDYCELIKAKFSNFPSKKQPLPVTPSSDPATISRVEALKINPCSFFFFQVSALSEQVVGGEREENWEGGALLPLESLIFCPASLS
jgi:hypothetical protein